MFKKQNTAWPSTQYDSLRDEDPMVVKVPMDNVDIGATKSTMAKARTGESGGNGRMGIRHVKNEN